MDTVKLQSEFATKMCFTELYRDRPQLCSAVDFKMRRCEVHEDGVSSYMVPLLFYSFVHFIFVLMGAYITQIKSGWLNLFSRGRNVD